MNDFPAGTLSATTFRKLPMLTPSINITNAITTANSSPAVNTIVA